MMEAQAIVARKLADTYAGTEKELRGLGSAHSQVMKEIGEAFEALGATAPFQFISEASLSGLKMARNIVMDITAALAGEDTTNRFFGRLHPATKGMQDSIDAAAKASAPAGGEFTGGVLPSEAKMKSEIAAAEASKKTLENYEKTVTASRDYIAALKLETEQVGLNAVQKKLMSDATEAAKAPTAALRMEIMKGAQALAESTVAAEAAVIATKLLADSVTGLADVGYKQVSSLQQQVDAQNLANAQIGMSVDQVLALVGAKELEEAANLRAAAQYAGPMHDAYIQYAADLEKTARLQKELASGKGAADALRDLNSFLDPAKAQTFGDALRGVFDGAGQSLVRLLDMMQVYEIKQSQIEKARKNNTAANSGDAKKYASVAKDLTDKEASNRITAFADMSRASKGFAEEGSATYEVLSGLEKALYLVQMANMAQKLLTSLFLTATQVRGNVVVAESAVVSSGLEATGNMVVAQTAAVASVANQGKGDPYTAFPRIAAMIAIMAGIGLMVAGGSASKPVIRMDEFAGRKASDGSGTVLGDTKAQSESIQNSLDALESYAKPGLTHTGQMVVLLQAIKNSLSGVTESLFANGFDSLGSTFKAVSKSSSGFLGIGGKSSSSSISDLGLEFSKQTIGEAMKSLGVQEYQVIKTEWSKKGFMGIGNKSGTNYDTTFKDVDASVSAAMTSVVNQMFEIVSKASKELGSSQDQIDQAKLMDTGLGKVSLFNKTGDEIEEILAAIFGKMGDSMAKIMMPGIDRFQKVGEGLLETLIRISSWNEYVNDTFNKLGLSVRLTGDAALDANIGIVDLFGGIEKMSELIDTYTDNFYSDAERQAMAMSSLEKEFAAMGKVMPTTNAGFRAMVEGIDLATASGQGMFVSMMKLGEAFAAVTEYSSDLAATAAAAAAEQEAFYADNFLTSQERLAPVQRDVLEQMAAMGLAAFTTKDDFAALVKSLKGTGIAGESTYQKLMTLAPAFATVADAATAAIEIAQAAADAKILAAQAAATAAISAAKADVETAKSKLITSYNTEKTSLEGVISKFTGFAAALLLLNSGLVSGADAAEGAYRAQVQLARAGNQAAISGLGGSQQAYLAAKLATAGTSIQYQRIVGSVMVTNTMLAATMLTEADAATQQLDALKTQVGLLVDINDSVMSVESAISGLSSAMSSLSSITLSANATLSKVTDAANATLKSVKAGAGIAQPGMSTDETFVTSLYNQLLRRAPDAAGLAGWTAQLAAGASPTSIIAGFTGSQEYMGSHADGLDMVPFDGYVAQLHGGERVKTAAAARQEDAMSSEIRSMRVELNAALVAIALNTGDTAKRIRKFDGEGLPATRT